jgi:hypothetical protein
VRFFVAHPLLTGTSLWDINAVAVNPTMRRGKALENEKSRTTVADERFTERHPAPQQFIAGSRQLVGFLLKWGMVFFEGLGKRLALLNLCLIKIHTRF